MTSPPQDRRSNFGSGAAKNGTKCRIRGREAAESEIVVRHEKSGAAGAGAAAPAPTALHPLTLPYLLRLPLQAAVRDY